MKFEQIDFDSLFRDREMIINFFNKESDFGCVLVATQFIDQCLRYMTRYELEINTELIDNLFIKSYGSLTNFSSKIKLARDLDIINNEIESDLKKIGEIRNLFAHSFRLKTFSDDSILEKCLELKYCNKSRPLSPKFEISKSTIEEKQNEGKTRFIHSVINIINELLGKSLISEFVDGKRKIGEK